jgi:hypothetical protein
MTERQLLEWVYCPGCGDQFAIGLEDAFDADLKRQPVTCTNCKTKLSLEYEEWGNFRDGEDWAFVAKVAP